MVLSSTSCLDIAKGNLQHTALQICNMLWQSNLNLMFENLHIVFGILVHQANAVFYELCHQPLCYLLFTLIRLFNGKYGLFIEQFYEWSKLQGFTWFFVLNSIISWITVQHAPALAWNHGQTAARNKQIQILPEAARHRESHWSAIQDHCRLQELHLQCSLSEGIILPFLPQPVFESNE